VRVLEAVRRRRTARAYRRVQARLLGPRLLAAFADAYPEARFVEIGSNDGEQHDHLRPFILSTAWRGIMVEPVPYVFRRLQRNYAGIDRVTLANVAVAPEDGELRFYHLAEADPAERDALPSWYDGIGSFSREAVLGHAEHIPDIAERVREIRVPALSFSSLLALHDMTRVDLVLVDTEGHDFEVLCGADLERHRPRLVVYEHYHLSREDRRACRELMAGAGYEIVEEGFDTFCLRPEDDALTRVFRAAEPAVAGVAAYEDRP
jgi:FkbM family methyltransferase